MSEIEAVSFEAAMSRLAVIVDRLDGGTVGLDESVELFREGQALAKRCEGLLKAAQDEIAKSQQPATPQPSGEADDGTFPDLDLPF